MLRSALWFVSKNPGVAVERAFAYCWVLLFAYVWEGPLWQTVLALVVSEIIMGAVGVYFRRPSWPDRRDPRDRKPSGRREAA